MIALEKVALRPLLPESPSFRLDGKRALVTGASRGIGMAAAAALAGAGAHVTLVARSGTELEIAVEAIRSREHSAEALVLDVTDLEATRSAILRSDPFDIFLNNAGMNRPRPFMEVSVEDFDVIMGLNVRAAFFAAQAVASRLVQEGRPGSIINVSSQMGHVGGENRTVYCASKFAVEGLTKAMAIELAPHSIRVNTICPTFIETPMTRPYFNDPRFAEITLSKIKLGRIGQVEDLTGAIVFLSCDASSLMTGTSIIIDGGYTAD